MTDPPEAAAKLARNAAQSLPEGALAAKLTAAQRTGRPLRVKLGIDPTSPDIHLGHTVVLRKLRDFQDLGHTVVLIVGDFTARVGDPSGRSQMRPLLSPEEIDHNARTYQEQAFKILDSQRVEVRHNSEWLDMAMSDLLALTRTTTVNRLLERDDFANRREAGKPISISELIYPLLVAYDSVAVDADVELGGTDQTFNLLFGRDIQRAYGRPEQAVMTMPLLVGIDGIQKMSKSVGNQIGVTDSPEEVYGRAMSIPDGVMEDYYHLLLAAEPPASLDARDAKRHLAHQLVAWLHSPVEADRAERHFDRVIVHNRPPETIEEATFDADHGPVHLPELIADMFAISRSQARRLIDQGAVSVDDWTLSTDTYDIEPDQLDDAVIKVGKRRFRRLRPRPPDM